jgi:hypothetical protein
LSEKTSSNEKNQTYKPSYTDTWSSDNTRSQSYDRKMQYQRCKIVQCRE